MAKTLNKAALARKLGICRQGLYYRSKMAMRDLAVKNQIIEVLGSNPCYGHKRIAIELKMNKKRILRVMKKYGLEPRKRRKKFIKTDDIGLPEAGYQNEVKGIHPQAPDIIWCGDFTYIKFKDGFIYLATIVDVYTREIIGFALSRRHNRYLVKSAALDAMKKRNRLPRYFHSDQGSEYQSFEHADFLKHLGVKVSMSTKSSPWENPFQESFYSQFKLELGNINRLENDGQLAEAIFGQIYYYNNQRIHSDLKMSPGQFHQLAASKVDGLNKSV
ncbi:MAG: IS3 family transposase [Patescibacteria group bacterium]|nr:IS3 family transposase [Patescibacteria group bacterium]